MELSKSYDLSKYFLSRIAPTCVRSEIVGSNKRQDIHVQVRGVHDIEFLAIPKYAQDADMFGLPIGDPYPAELTALIDQMLEAGTIATPKRPANGPRYKKFAIPGCEYYETVDGDQVLKEFCLEFWIVNEKTWGIQNLIRTGPSAFSQRCVTSDNERCFHKPSGKTYRGLLPAHYEYVTGETKIRIRNVFPEQVLDLPEEKDAIRLLGLRAKSDYWIPPEERYMYT